MVLPALLATLGAVHFAKADAPSPDTDTVCQALYAEYPHLVVFDPLGPNGLLTISNISAYSSANTGYWNAASSLNRAACAFFPSAAEQVSLAIQTLNKYPSVQFATKCAGHNPNLGFSSVDEGVLVSFRPNSNYAIPSADGMTIDVGAGAKWEDVYGALQPLGKAAVGGRLGDIGTVGFTLGGGLSYLSAQYGLACDNVVNFEVVLADGTMDNANATHNPDLFFALRGGGNQFAIITKMTLKTYNIGNDGTVWGGVRIYGADQHVALLAAVANFTANNNDPKAAIIPTFDFLGIAVDVPLSIVFFFYDDSSLSSGVFDSILGLPYLVDDLKSQSYLDLTTQTLAGNGDIEGLRFQIRANTFPNMPVSAMSDFLTQSWTLMYTGTAVSAITDLVDVRIFSMTVQPLSRLITASSADSNGGNALGLDPASGDRVWLEYDLGWLSPLCDSSCPAFVENLADNMHNLHAANYSGIYPTHYQSGDLDYISYNPLFMNDAMYDQDVLTSYGDGNYQRLKEIQTKYDPSGFIASHTNGFKIAS